MAMVLSIWLPKGPRDRNTQEILSKEVYKWLEKFSPLIELDYPPEDVSLKRRIRGIPQHPINIWCQEKSFRFHGINIDIEKSLKLFKGISSITREIYLHLKISFGISKVRLCTSSNFTIAWALSRGAEKNFITHMPNNTEILYPLPLESLRISEESILALRELGFSKVGELLTLTQNKNPRSLRSLPEAVISQLLEIIQERAYSLEHQEKKKKISLHYNFENTVSSHEIAKNTIDRLFYRLDEVLTSERLTCGKLDISIYRENLPNTSKTIVLYQAFSRIAEIKKVLDAYLLTLSMEKVKEIHIDARKLFPKYEKQENIFSNSKAYLQSNLGILDLLQSEISSQDIFILQHKNSHIPERSFCYLPLSEFNKNKDGIKKSCLENGQGSNNSFIESFIPFKTNRASLDSGSILLSLDRPTFILKMPVAIKAVSLLPDKPPGVLQYRGKKFRIANGSGPERLSPEWWKLLNHTEETRDYFKLALEEGLVIWVYRELETLSWYIHGIWA